MWFLLALQNSPVIVDLVGKPSEETSFFDVLVGSFSVTGILVLIAAVLGVLFAFVLVQWHKRHRPESDHLPPVVP